MFNKIIIFVLMTTLVSAINIELDCPDEIFIDEEFECEVEVNNGSALYDLKIEADKNRDSILRIWDGDKWQSGYFYIKDFVRDDEVVKLKILESGKFNLIAKLRDGNWRKDFDVGKVQVEEKGTDEEDVDEKRTDEEDVDTEKKESDSLTSSARTAPLNSDKENGDSDKKTVKVISLGENNIILLGENKVANNKEKEWDYISKDGMVIDWLAYMFSLFMIFLVGILLWDRRNE